MSPIAQGRLVHPLARSRFESKKVRNEPPVSKRTPAMGGLCLAHTKTIKPGRPGTMALRSDSHRQALSVCRVSSTAPGLRAKSFSTCGELRFSDDNAQFALGLEGEPKVCLGLNLDRFYRSSPRSGGHIVSGRRCGSVQGFGSARYTAKPVTAVDVTTASGALSGYPNNTPEFRCWRVALTRSPVSIVEHTYATVSAGWLLRAIKRMVPAFPNSDGCAKCPGAPR